MKYLFINTVAGSGSTGKIAANQCRDLQKQGHQCVLAYGRWKANCDDIETYRIGTALDYRLHGMYTRISDRHGFGSKVATRKFLKWVENYNPDVIWLHNLHGYYINIEMLFDYLKKADKKVFWTLHDCWSFTGHCAHFTYAKCDKWKIGCYQCVQKNCYPKSIICDHSKENYERKRKTFCGIKNMTLIVPSQWLADLVKESFLKDYLAEIVRNDIDKSIFKPTMGSFRAKYGLENKKILLGVASTWDERKGLDDYLKLAGMLSSDYKIVLVGLNKRQMKNLPDNVLGLAKTESAEQLAEIYTAADVFVNLSYEENYPTVNLEAQTCGTTVVAYDTGGMKETLDEKSKGNLVSVGNVEEVKRRIGMILT
ncbi:MAG: glycosyltransferase [Butyrivibrio sp.]|nr:glycosyltransferase [Butyrivibrio sp.]